MMKTTTNMDLIDSGKGLKMADDQWDESLRGPKMSESTGSVIFKYQMPVQESFTMRLPTNSEIIRMAAENGMFWLWAVVDTNADDEERQFHSVKCGGAMPDIEDSKDLVFRGTCQIFIQQELMLYIFEEVKF